jgi:branched-chain amino acid transport system substrate-binding protein
VIFVRSGTPQSTRQRHGAFVSFKASLYLAPEAYAIYGYASTAVLLAAIDKFKKKDRAAIRKAILDKRNYEGALGTWSFDANGDTTLQQLTVFKIEKKKFIPFKVLSAK